ncbi:exo-alpha-sialidase [Parapedobacter tibetensis]|uniref:exo-alpha-sialidase n=1 Tax=Parapedobacter tibetensis TaxID=2972951 RepID=UPI00214D4D96|nr:exo-alpha-sialidase [Parapedobacter tibetensis]
MVELSKVKGLVAALVVINCGIVHAQDTVHYTGETLSNVDYHHGQLAPAVGVHNIQVLRANRTKPALAEGYGWTYNHAPMLAYRDKQFYLQFLAGPVGEHIPPSQTYISKSADGYSWSIPEVVFPPYRIPDGYKKEGSDGVAKDLYAIMHQRMGFYTAKNGRLLTLGYYGIAMDAKDDPNDGKGIGRVIREIHADGTYGPIYFIRYNASWNPKDSEYPFYKDSRDKGFVAACEELLANPLMMMQWVEEADRDDPLIPLKKQYKAFSYYHLNDGRVVGLWKHALTAISEDGGRTWPENAVRAPGFVNSNAKIWGQRTTDGKYVTVYNPSEYRWPLALSVSDDGLVYDNLLLVNGEIPPMRFGGNYKSYGPQYVRGIQEGNGLPSNGHVWITYSMNKEDIWVAKIPIPIVDRVTENVRDEIQGATDIRDLALWNIYSPLWAPVTVEQYPAGEAALVLKDRDRYDYAVAERVVPHAKHMEVSFSITPGQNDHGHLDIEFTNDKGTPFVRLSLDSAGQFTSKAGSRYKQVAQYEANTTYDIKVTLDVAARSYRVHVNGKDALHGIAFSPVDVIARVKFRTGEIRRFPHADTPADQTVDLPLADEPVDEAVYQIGYFNAIRLNTNGQ